MNKNFHMIAQQSALVVSISIFVIFGLYKIGSFETTDEHFWKFDRIEKYYAGWHEGRTEGTWKKTRLNDKPGVSVALINGAARYAGYDSEALKLADTQPTTSSTAKQKYRTYDTERVVETNAAYRAGGVLWSACVIIPLLYWALCAVWRAQKPVAVGSIFLIATSPILVGISKVINPDAFLWGASAIALLAFSAWLVTAKKGWLLLTALATGFALLSKYTAMLLFFFYPLLAAMAWMESAQQWRVAVRRYIGGIALIVCGACFVFALGMPAVIQAPAHFLYGTFYAPPVQPLVEGVVRAMGLEQHIFLNEEGDYRTVEMLVVSVTTFAVVVFGGGAALIALCIRFAHVARRCALIAVSGIGLMLMASLYNAWSGTPLFSLTDIKEYNRVKGALAFPDFAEDAWLVFYAKALLVQAQNFIFSLSAVVWCGLIAAWVHVWRQRTMTAQDGIVIALSLFPYAFFIGGLASEIFVNIRYSIMLYVPYYVVAAYGYYAIWQFCATRHNLRKSTLAGLVLIVCVQFYTLYKHRDFPFVYHSALLPQQYAVADAWGYGLYEAAQYLNAQEQATDLVAWTDHPALCQFFVGKCITSREIYWNENTVDVLVQTRRGMLTRKPLSRGGEAHVPQSFALERYYNDAAFIKEHTLWELHINGRSASVVRVLGVEHD